MTHENHPQQIIDRVPSQDELVRMQGFVPQSLMSHELQTWWGAESEQDARVLDTLSNELMWGQLNEERIASLYDVSRHIGDAVVVEDSTNGREAFALVEASRSYARPQHLRELPDHLKGEAQGTHSEAQKLMTMDIEGLSTTSQQLIQRMEQEGHPFNEPKHAYLAAYLSVAAHESGHAILSGVSKLEKSLRPGNQYLLATSMFLGQHPEMAMTGNWEDDVKAHEERFAEGYAKAVTTEAFKALGYSDEDCALINTILTPEVDPDKAWERGYAAPLAREELAAELSELSLMIKAQTYTKPPEPESWSSDAASHRAAPEALDVPGDKAQEKSREGNEGDNTSNWELTTGLLSDEARAQRKQFLKDQLAGEYDARLGHIGRLLERSEIQFKESLAISEEGGIAASSQAEQKRLLSQRTRETASRLFGDDLVQQYKDLEMMLYQLDKQDGHGQLVFRGEEALTLYEKIVEPTKVVDDGIDRAHTVPPTERAVKDRSDYQDYLLQKRFIASQTLQKLRADGGEMVLHTEQELHIPLANVISAGGLNNWCGRRRETGFGSAHGDDDKSYENRDGQRVTARSLDVIIDYAERDTPLPPLRSIDAYVQPNGIVLFCAPVSNHRTAAAAARGLDEVVVDGEVSVYALRENIYESE